MGNYARVSEIVDFLQNEVGDNVIFYTQSDLIDPGLWEFYNANSNVVDKILKRKYKNFVIEDIDRISETPGDKLEKYRVLRSQLDDANKVFFANCANSINRLWEVESLKFSPIENYDSYTENKVVKTGSELEKVTESGKEINQNKFDGQNVKQNVRTGTVKNTNSGTITDTTDNASTSYNTNQIDTVTKNVTDGTATTTEYDKLTDIETDTPRVTTTGTKSFEGRDTSSETTYNQVTDTFTEHKHGNIGVSTSTSILAEYTNYFELYHFWERFWSMWITINASPIFETDKSYYIND